MRGTIIGGVQSGQPHRTTLGNTIRVISFMKYIRSRYNLKFDFLVVGDDVLVITDVQCVNSIRQALLTIYIDADKPGFD